MTNDLQTPCYCGNTRPYSECCQPYHEHQQWPDTAEQLMRSRYSACYLKKSDYLIETTWPAQQQHLTNEDISAWLNRTQWHQLQILETRQGSHDDSRGQVKFEASYSDPLSEDVQIHDETSEFIQEQNRWYFIFPGLETQPPTMAPDVAGRNDPCPCGSGSGKKFKKFKKCCL